MFPGACLFRVGRRVQPRFTKLPPLKRSYAIRDKYIFPPKQLTPEQMVAEEEQREKTELNRQKQLDDLAKRMRKENLIEVRIKEPADDIRYFQFQPPLQPSKPRSMTIALVGIPNAGKSTLVNRLVGSKISAVSTKAQTTREAVLGIATIGSTQLCFIDTPGVVDRAFQKRVRRDLVIASWNAIEEADHVLVILDSVKTIDRHAEKMIEKLRTLKSEGLTPDMTLVLNKADLVASINPTHRHGIEDRIKRHIPDIEQLFSRTFVISALNGSNVADLQSYLIDAAPRQEWAFDPSMKTDLSPVQRVEEVVREKVFKFLNRELPYQIHLELVGWTPKKNGALRLDINIYVAKESQKKILWGTKGLVISSIQREATQDMQSFLDRPVELYLSLKVRARYAQEDEDDFAF